MATPPTRRCLQFVYSSIVRKSTLKLVGLNVGKVVRQCAKKTSQVDQISPSIKFLLPFLVPVMAASGDNKDLIEEIEALHEKEEFCKEYDLLTPHKESSDPDLLWRFARAATDLGKERGGEERKTKIYEAFGYITKALELDDNNFACHKWFGILLDYTAEYEGTKQRISNAFKVKEHFMKAIELNPKDSTTLYCLGTWCFLFADMSWLMRKTASVIFASPPTSTYDEALGYFKKAEENDPGFYNKNKVMLGKVYLRLKDKEAAKVNLMKSLEYTDTTVDDTEARKEATDLLKELGVNV